MIPSKVTFLDGLTGPGCGVGEAEGSGHDETFPLERAGVRVRAGAAQGVQERVQRQIG